MPLFWIWIGIVVGSLAASGTNGPVFAEDLSRDQAFDRCKAIDDDGLRLNCLRSIIQEGGPPGSRDSMAQWRMMETADTHSNRKAVSIVRTADTTRSDPALAGLMIRCGGNASDGNANLEVLVALLDPLPLRAHPIVTMKSDRGESRFTASVAIPGALVLLPPEAEALATGPWQGFNELTIDIEDAGRAVHGVVALGGLRSALSKLTAGCPREAALPP
jgi:hypothetical protein